MLIEFSKKDLRSLLISYEWPLFDHPYFNQDFFLKNSWIDICEHQDEYNFKTVVILQPLVGTGNKQLTPEEEKYFKYYDGENKIKHYQLYANALTKLEPKCTTTNDLRNVFDSNSETVFFDFGHTDKNGNSIIAKKFFEIITPIIIEDLENE